LYPVIAHIHVDTRKVYLNCMDIEPFSMNRQVERLETRNGTRFNLKVNLTALRQAPRAGTLT